MGSQRARIFVMASVFVVTLGFVATSYGDSVQTLDTLSYNFQLSGGGGGASALLGNTSLELYCIDFANDIFVPHSNYSAYETPINSSKSLSNTRFGDNTSWRKVTISDGDPGNDATDSNIINAAASGLDRYEMAAYLVSTYNFAAQGSPANNGIQDAIWTLLDPTGFPAIPAIGNPNDGLESAAIWFNSTTVAQRDSFLQGFDIISDSTMTECHGSTAPLCGGFQEQIGIPTPASEPSSLLLLGTALSLLGIALRRKRMA